MNKIDKIFNILKKKRCDSAVFNDAVNVRYISGYNAPDGIVVLTKKKSCLLVDYRYNGLKPERNDDNVLELVVTATPLVEAAYDILHTSGAKAAALDTSAMSYDLVKKFRGVFDSVKCVGISGICKEMRSSKDEYELDMIRKAQKITDDAFDYILGKISPEMTENELAAELEYFIRRRGGGISFDTIAVSGTMSAVPHGTPRDVKIGKNTFVTMDFGATWNGYHADMTRTVVLGKADDDMKTVYNTVLEAQKRGLAAARAGISGSEVDEAARSYIVEQGYGGNFTHSLGHSVGLEIHEAPGFSKMSMSFLPVNAVVTVEPGIYIPGKYGVRIEDMVVLKEDGSINLTSSPKELIEL